MIPKNIGYYTSSELNLGAPFVFGATSYPGRYWPQWMTATSLPISGSLLSSFQFAAMSDVFQNVTKDIDDLKGALTFDTLYQPRLAWTIYTEKPDYFQTSAYFFTGSVSGYIRRAGTIFDFIHSMDPVCFLFSDGVLYLRNLEMREVETTPSSGYTITLEDLVPDCEVWIRQGNEFVRVPSHERIGNTIYVPRQTSCIVRYSSLALANTLDASGTVKIDNNPATPLLIKDLSNCWDSHALLLGTTRFPREDNIKLYNRLRALNGIQPGHQIGKVEAGVGGRVDLLGITSWYSSGALTMASLGISDASYVNVENLFQRTRMVENARKISNNIYRLSKTPIAATLRLRIGGEYTWPASSLGNIVTFFETPNSEVTAEYLFESYTVERGADGFIISVTPVTYNLMPMDRNVYITRGIRSITLNDDIDILYNPDGTGTDYMLEVAQSIKDKVRVTLGFVNWDRAHWYFNSERRPNMSYIPRALDI